MLLLCLDDDYAFYFQSFKDRNTLEDLKVSLICWSLVLRS